MGDATQITNILGGPKVLGTEVRGIEDLIALIHRGLPVMAMTSLAVYVGVERRLLGQWMGLSDRALARRLSGRSLTPHESDRAVRIARVFVRAEAALHSRAKASLWLRRPNRALGQVEPGSLLDTDVGAQMVTDVLGRIEHGTFS